MCDAPLQEIQESLRNILGNAIVFIGSSMWSLSGLQQNPLLHVCWLLWMVSDGSGKPESLQNDPRMGSKRYQHPPQMRLKLNQRCATIIPEWNQFGANMAQA